MGRVILVTGGSASGKSAFAEELAVRFRGFSGGEMIYLAAMDPSVPGNAERILRHRRNRSGKGFRTAELSRDVGRLEAGAEDTVLLECLSNLAANEMFLPDGTAVSQEETEKKLLAEIRSLASRAGTLIIVGGRLSEELPSYGEGTRAYLQVFSRVQNMAAEIAEEVYEVTAGIPVRLK